MIGSFAAIAGLAMLLAIAAAADASAWRRVSDILISSLCVFYSLPNVLNFLTSRFSVSVTDYSLGMTVRIATA
jgi:hypothetical protein